MIKYCKVCGVEINPKRVECLPHVNTCIAHSDAQRVAGYQIITGKNTYSELEIGPQERIAALYDLGSRAGQGPVKGNRMKGH